MSGLELLLLQVYTPQVHNSPLLPGPDWLWRQVSALNHTGVLFPRTPWVTLSLTTSKTESLNFNIVTALTFSFANPIIRIYCSVIAIGFFNLISSVTL